MSDNIKVVVKVRPLIPREVEEKLSYQWRVNNNSLVQIDSNGKDFGPCFTFDKVYDRNTETCDVYKDIAKPIVEAAIAGFNGTIFAYGQTSSGKTYTMTGTDDAPGIIQLAVINLFENIKNIPDREFLVRVSYVEIYNESLIDLLDLKKSIKISEGLQGVKVDATEKMTTSPEEVLDVMREGKVNRQTGSTNMNEESSRSHSIFQITIESRDHIEGKDEEGSVNVSQLNLVDLAGSERAGQTGATGLRFKEGTHINKSLSSLALVIKQLSEDPHKHVNYRDSKLTRILQNSLGGNAKTSIICAVTPAAVEETISTLQFANRAKAIKNSPAVNIVATDNTMIQNLTKQLSNLKTQLEGKKSVEQDNHNLQKRIGRLQNLILNGFVQRSNADLMGGARRKLQPPRRVTISTLHSIEEDAVPSVPRFCTPVLKYNPLLAIPSISEFHPIQSASSLPTVSEETPRLVTPPPRDKKVNFSDEIIEIDSDEDGSFNTQSCSPYHKCFESKTPPCVLRKNAKIAEKNLKDIVELTERERLYTPNVVELMENLDKKAASIAKLEDHVNTLTEMSKQKDIEMELLKSKVSEADAQIASITAAKVVLEDRCNDYNTKLTDLEVSYESLQKKARNREKELLSLLEEHLAKINKNKLGIAVTSSIENEFKELTANMNNDTPKQIIEGLDPDYHVQMLLKDQTILELQAKLEAQTTRIESFENINKEFKNMLQTCKEKILSLENENSLHISKLECLNSVVTTQKSLIDNMDADNKSYNNVIQELQMKLANKDNTSNIEFNTMLANEEMFLANNDNLRNSIESLRSGVNSKKEELKKLKTAIEESNTTDIETLKIELENKKEEVSVLLGDIQKLKNQHAADLKEISLKNDYLSKVEQDLTEKVTKIQECKNCLEKDTEAHLLELKNLKEFNENLNITLAAREQDIEHLKKQNEVFGQKISKLEYESGIKDNRIATLDEEDKSSLQNLELARVSVVKLKEILKLLTGNMNEVPDLIDNFVMAFNILNDNLTSLETVANELVYQKKILESVNKQREEEVTLLQLQLDGFRDIVHVFCSDCENILLIKPFIEDENSEDEKKCEYLKHWLTYITDSLKTTQLTLSQDLHTKDVEIEELKVAYKFKETQLDEETTKVSTTRQDMQIVVEKGELFLQGILKKCYKVLTCFGIVSDISCQLDTHSDTVYESILSMLDKIPQYITSITTECIDKHNAIENTISNSKMEIQKLTEENIKLMENISDLETKNLNLSERIKKMHSDNININKDFKNSAAVLESLKNDITSKVDDIKVIETKVKDWKGKFNDLDAITKEQVKQLKDENADLLQQVSKLKRRNILSNICNPNQNQGDVPVTYIDIVTPPSLLTICCNKIINHLELNEIENSSSISVSESDCTRSDLQNTYQCEKLMANIDSLKKENTYLNSVIENIEFEKVQLRKEQEDVRKEVQSLLDLSNELQKQIIKHRTNLSTLTAMTYAENKSLSSQVKFYQHYHSRFYNICQKDIPPFKKQLQDLMLLLSSENFGRQNDASKFNILDSTLHFTLRNESILDPDLLMLDTNVTLTTCDNTLLGHDHTGLDLTQVNVFNDVACQTNLTDLNTFNLLHSQIDPNIIEDQKILSTIQCLKEENDKLRRLVDEYTRYKSLQNKTPTATSVAAKIVDICQACDHAEQLRVAEINFNKGITLITKQLHEVESQKRSIEEQYNNLSLEMPNIESLVRKLNNIEKDSYSKQSQIDQLNNALNNKNSHIKGLREENESLSNQIMETISEVDELKTEQEILKNRNVQLIKNNSDLEVKMESLHRDMKSIKKMTCNECKCKLKSLRHSLDSDTCTKLNRSYSDSETSSRLNKMCALQNELHAGKEDCKQIKEEVTTIKNHLEENRLSQAMDLDESIVESNMFSSPRMSQCNISQNLQLDNYSIDKLDCINYFIEKSNSLRSDIDSDVKIIDIMKMLYEDIVINHKNEVENLVNKLKDFEEAKLELQKQIAALSNEKLTILKKSKENDICLQTLAEIVNDVNYNLKSMRGENDMVTYFKDKYLLKVDREFGLNGTPIFETIIENISNRHKEELINNELENQKIFEEKERISKDLLCANNNLSSLHTKLDEAESNYKSLCAQKDKVTENFNTFTLDLQRKDQELKDIVNDSCRKIVENNLLKIDKIDLTLPVSEIVQNLIGSLLNSLKPNSHNKNEIELNRLLLEVESAKQLIQNKEEEIGALSRSNEAVSMSLSEMELKINTQITLYNDLKDIYQKKVDENKVNMSTIEKLTEEVGILKEVIISKDSLIKTIESKLQCQHETLESENKLKLTQLMQTVSDLQKEIDGLKLINNEIRKEKESLTAELEQAGNIIKNNKVDLEKLTSDIIEIKETARDNITVIEKFKLESKSLTEEKINLQKLLQEKNKHCSQLQMNIKTHERTAEVQSKMINRLNKLKDDMDKTSSEKDKKLEDLTVKCKLLQDDSDKLNKEVQAFKGEFLNLKNAKEYLEARVKQLETELEEARDRLSVGPSESTRQRRQSIHDSKRMFAEEFQDDKTAETAFKSHTPTEDFYMDVDSQSSSRSTPARLSRGRDSESSRHDHSEHEQSRAGSGQSARRRRQSAHDLRRHLRNETGRRSDSPPGAKQHLSPINTLTIDNSNQIESTSFESSGNNNSVDSEVAVLKKRLTACQEELEDLKEKYRELDEECDTCAEYLRERDEQCLRLKREKVVLERSVQELHGKLKDPANNVNTKKNLQDACVNTDEDWIYQHSVVVDRMSYNAEVDKNKKLMKNVEKLRYEKEDLKTTLTKMQKALDRHSSKDSRELEATKTELEACKRELEELRAKYKELDEECETCVTYLREREQQCRELKEAKEDLEIKLQEYVTGNITHTVRKKRQTLHDQNRGSSSQLTDASTETTDDFLSYQVEKDGCQRLGDEKQLKEVKYLRMYVEKLSQQKAALEMQLQSAPTLQYVATGSAIVQNQQITDVMKENQKLKKINAKLVTICKKRGKSIMDSNRENEDPEQ